MKRNNSSNKKKMLDQIDCQMIELLQKDGRIPNTEIAKKLGVSEATARSRLNRLIEEEYIQIVAVSNPIKLGFKIVGILRIKVDINKIESVTKELSKLKSIWFVVHATGDSDIYTEFVAKSLDELNDLIFNKIYKINGVVRTETSLISWLAFAIRTARARVYTLAPASKALGSATIRGFRFAWIGHPIRQVPRPRQPTRLCNITSPRSPRDSAPCRSLSLATLTMRSGIRCADRSSSAASTKGRNRSGA